MRRSKRYFLILEKLSGRVRSGQMKTGKKKLFGKEPAEEEVKKVKIRKTYGRNKNYLRLK